MTGSRGGAMQEIGERVASIDAGFKAFERYSHEKWHDLANTLQPLVLLPEKMTREVAKMQGSFDERLNSVSKELERSIASAIEKALKPITDDVESLRKDVETLKIERLRMTGARLFGVWIFQTILAAAAAAGSVLALGRHP